MAPSVVDTLLSRAEIRADRHRQTNEMLGRLTDREQQVLRLIASGATNEEIGRQLFIAEPTVKTHVGRVLSKLGLRDRVQAVILAYEAGLVGPGHGDTATARPRHV